LWPLRTRLEYVSDAGQEYVIRTLTALPEKPLAGEVKSDPFSPPYERGLHVADLRDTHAVLLNKYNVLERHLLVVTTRPAEQTGLLDRADFAAWLTVLAGNDALGFHNGGVEASASQPHRHMQAVPLSERDPVFPLAPAFEGVAGVDTGRVMRLPALPFQHVAVRLDPSWREAPERAARTIAAHYRAMWAALGMEPSGEVQPMPYNLLIARDWMWLVPRRQESFDGISINGLGFAGALLAPDPEARDRLCAAGPGRALSAVAGIQ